MSRDGSKAKAQAQHASMIASAIAAPRCLCPLSISDQFARKLHILRSEHRSNHSDTWSQAIRLKLPRIFLAEFLLLVFGTDSWGKKPMPFKDRWSVPCFPAP